MMSAIKSFIKYLLFLFEYVVYEITYYFIGGEAIIHDLIYKSKNKFELENRPELVAVVTGGARGIGSHLVKALLQCEIHVIICCRNIDAGKKFVAKIRENGVTTGSTYIYELDLMSLASVESCVKQIQKDFESINILVNNAGIMFPPYAETAEGFESQWGVNYVGPFLLTHLLLPLLEKAPATFRGRIVNVTSCAHVAAKPIAFDDINMAKYFISSKAYAQSKLAQILFTVHLEKILRVKDSCVHVLSVHPGVVNTDIFNGTPLKLFFPWILQYICKNGEEGATTVLHACISTDLEQKGGLYLSNCMARQPSKLATDPLLQSNLFNHTMKTLNITEFGHPEI